MGIDTENENTERRNYERIRRENIIKSYWKKRINMVLYV